MRSEVIFLLLNTCNLVCNIALSIIAPFFPTFADKEGISENIVGYIFSAHPLGQLIASLILGKMITRDNRSNLMNIGIVSQGVSLIGFGFLYFFVGHKITIIALSIIARLIGGFGAAMFMTPFYAYIPLLFPNSYETKIALAEISTSMGFLIGPICGSFLYTVGGFMLPFFTFGCVSLILALLIPFMKQSLKLSVIQGSTIEQPILHRSIHNDISPESELEIQYKDIMVKFPIIISILMTIVANVIYTFYLPITATYFDKQFQIPPEKVGYYISISSFAYGIGSMLVSRVGRKHRAYYIYFGMVICGYLQFFMGPDQTFTNLKPALWISLLTRGISGLVMAFPYVLALPQMNTILSSYYPNYPLQCANIASALFNSCLATGELIGPVAGGYLTQIYSYQRASSILGMSLLLTSALYLPYLYNQKIEKVRLSKV